MKKNFILIFLILILAILPSFFEIYNDINNKNKIIPINEISRNLLLKEKLNYPIKVAIFGDSKKGTKVLEHIIKDAKRNGCKMAFHLGDIIPYYDKNFYKYFYSEFVDMIKDYHIPIFLIPGDHDTFDKNGNYKIAYFEKFFGDENFILKIKKTIFLCLNNSKSKINKKFIDKIKNNLTPKELNKFIFYHIPTQDFRKGHHHCLKNKNLINYLENFIVKNNFKAVFSSHIHFYGKYYIKQIPCYISGEAGAYLIFKRNYSYLILTIYKNGNFSVKKKILKWEYGLDFQDYFETYLLKLFAFLKKE